MKKLVCILLLILSITANGASLHNKNNQNINGSPVSVNFTRDMSSESLNGLITTGEDLEDDSGKIHTEELIRFYENVKEGKNQLKEVLKADIQMRSLEEVAAALFYSYQKGYPQAYLAIIEGAKKRIKGIVELFEGTARYPDNFINDLKRFCFADEDDYVLVSHADAAKIRRPFLNIEDFMHLEAHHRFPAAIRFISELPLSDDQINSRFISNNVLNYFDLRTILVLYELEMMDRFHRHDGKGVIEKHLKRAIFFESNVEMAKLAHQMYINSYFKALKMIIDEKFSYESPLKNPFWFQDLFSLFKFADENAFPPGFQKKVMQLAEASAMRHYSIKMGYTSAN